MTIEDCHAYDIYPLDVLKVIILAMSSECQQLVARH